MERSAGVSNAKSQLFGVFFSALKGQNTRFIITIVRTIEPINLNRSEIQYLLITEMWILKSQVTCLYCEINSKMAFMLITIFCRFLSFDILLLELLLDYYTWFIHLLIAVSVC